MVCQALRKHGISQRMACTVFHISISTYRYQGIHVPENEVIADWLLRLTTTHRRWGFGLCFMYLRNVKQFTWNHKRIYRIYRQLELNLRIKPKRRIKRDKPDALQVPSRHNQVWSMDFMSDALSDGRSLRSPP
jgi:putative transposase